MTERNKFRTGGGINEFRQIAEGGDREDPLVGSTLGSYRLLSLLAEGGMGRVYLGERIDGQFTRQVAIKILSANLDSAHARRFEQEREILASLTHSNIAQLYDSGVSKNGRLYLVMELVDGLPITEHAAHSGIGTRAKVALMLSLCNALAYAHSKMVVHRDIKPSNVLVTAEGELKLLDFGIAKLLESSDGLTTTEHPMTPRYASPEQLLSAPISVASDIYQIGLLFIELLGKRNNLADESLESSIQRALEEKPLTAEMLLAEQAPVELSAIINQCLRSRPGERYVSASALAMDLSNHLKGYPVSARNPGAIQRGMKLVRRNWIASAALAGVVISLLIFLLLSLHQQSLTELARQAAERQQARAEQTTRFLIGLFDENRPRASLGKDLSARDILERGLERLQSLDDQPALQADLMETIASVYRNLGDYDQALALATQALAIKETIHSPDSLEVASTLFVITQLHDWGGRYQQALEAAERSHAIRLAHLGANDVETLDSLNAMATALQRLERFDEAEQLMLEVLDGKRALYGENHTDVTTALNNLSVLYGVVGKYAKALELRREVMAWNKVQLPADHPWAAMDINNLGFGLSVVGRYDEAAVAYQESLDMRRKVQGDKHPLFAVTLSGKAAVMVALGHLNEAENMYRQAIDVLESGTRRPGLHLATALDGLAALQILKGDLDAAERNLEDSCAQYKALELENSLDYRMNQSTLANLRLAQERPKEALALLKPIAEKGHAPHEKFPILLALARSERTLGNETAARELLQRAKQLYPAQEGAIQPQLADVYLEIAQLELNAGNESEAQSAIGAANSALETLPPQHWKRAVALALLGELQMRRDQVEAARQNLTQAFAELEQTFPSGNPHLTRAKINLAALDDNEH